MTYDLMPLEELVGLFVETLLRSSAKREDLDLANETATIGSAIIARGDAAAEVLLRLLDDPREDVQLLAAVELSELDPYAAAPTLERLEREAVDPAVGSFAELKLHNNRQRGLLPAR